MAKNSYGQYTATSLVPDGRGETTPFVELCESVVPHIGTGLMPAPWLPIKRYDDWAKSGVVMSVGIAVGYDSNGYLIPAGIVGGTTTVTYSAYDVTMGVINVSDGAAVETADIGSPITIPSGLVSTTGAKPIGIAYRNIYQHLGGFSYTAWGVDPVYTLDNNNPWDYRMHNTTKEDYVCFTCDYVIEVPWIGASESTLAGLSATALSYVHAYGAFEYGGFVKVDDKGCYIPATATSDVLSIGQVLGFKTYPQSALNRVKTAYEGHSNVNWQMPGSATKGIPRSIHLATDGQFAAGTSSAAASFTSIIINIQK